ncbi:Unknown protein sequence [Pseudomonas savastanoi pv. nerii]|nr:Unknown protein sequence [Pseudomonas savastanoi pv. nerii]RMN61195.1 hypothetical protein ALQ55_05277 [Pseudomonas savastanoi pv. savastanoi]RMR79570.1 hypothetical protein ALP80_04475 [Pseudomonas savastanoi pv. fraxini]RMU45177.1 hypothetical protein ALP28_05428 [Pseudomonas savastanoi pv. nerii]
MMREAGLTYWTVMKSSYCAGAISISLRTGTQWWAEWAPLVTLFLCMPRNRVAGHCTPMSASPVIRNRNQRPSGSLGLFVKAHIQFVDHHRPFGILMQLLLEKVSLPRRPEVGINQLYVVRQGVAGDERFDALIVRIQCQLGEQVVDGRCSLFHVISSPGDIPVFISSYGSGRRTQEFDAFGLMRRWPFVLCLQVICFQYSRMHIDRLAGTRPAFKSWSSWPPVSGLQRFCDTAVYKRYISRSCHEPVESATRLHKVCGGAFSASACSVPEKIRSLDAVYGLTTFLTALTSGSLIFMFEGLYFGCK